MTTNHKLSKEDITFEVGGDNIFADIGVVHAEDELLKAELTFTIHQIIKKRKLTQANAAKIMGINQPKVSALLHRKLSGFSVERLMHFLNQLGFDIEITIKQKPRNQKGTSIKVFSG